MTREYQETQRGTLRECQAKIGLRLASLDVVLKFRTAAQKMEAILDDEDYYQSKVSTIAEALQNIAYDVDASLWLYLKSDEAAIWRNG